LFQASPTSFFRTTPRHIVSQTYQILRKQNWLQFFLCYRLRYSLHDCYYYYYYASFNAPCVGQRLKTFFFHSSVTLLRPHGLRHSSAILPTLKNFWLTLTLTLMCRSWRRWRNDVALAFETCFSRPRSAEMTSDYSERCKWSFSPPGFEVGYMFCWCFIFLLYFSDFFQTDYLNIHRTDVHKICRNGRTLAVDERFEVILVP